MTAYYFTRPTIGRPLIYKVNANTRSQAIIKLAEYETGKVLTDYKAFEELEALGIEVIPTIMEL